MRRNRDIVAVPRNRDIVGMAWNANAVRVIVNFVRVRRVNVRARRYPVGPVNDLKTGIANRKVRAMRQAVIVHGLAGRLARQNIRAAQRSRTRGLTAARRGGRGRAAT